MTGGVRFARPPAHFSSPFGAGGGWRSCAARGGGLWWIGTRRPDMEVRAPGTEPEPGEKPRTQGSVRGRSRVGRKKCQDSLFGLPRSRRDSGRARPVCRGRLVRCKLFCGSVLWLSMPRCRPPRSRVQTRAGPGRELPIAGREPSCDEQSSAPIDSANPAFWHPSRGAPVGWGRVTGGVRFARPPANFLSPSRAISDGR